MKATHVFARWLGASFLGLLVTHCSSQSASPLQPQAGTAPYSCNYPGSGFCDDFTGSAYTGVAALQYCSAGTLSTGSCTATNRIGSCLTQSGQALEVVLRYYSPNYDTASAQANCQSATGTYTPG